jgi:hypothetical protein
LADLYLTREQLEDLFWRLTTQILGFDPDLPTNASKVRISWPTDGAPTWKITEDVTFIRIGEQDDPINILRDTLTESNGPSTGIQSTGQTRVIRVHWLCYGPSSFDNAFKIRNLLFAQQYREPLSVNQIYLIPEIDTPRRLPELRSGQWWERTDLAANFNELIRFETTVPLIESVEVTIKNNDNQNELTIDESTKTH